MEGNSMTGNAAFYQVTYLAEDGTMKTVSAKLVTPELHTLDGSWYVVTGNLDMAELDISGQPTNLILADGANLTLSGQLTFRGIGLSLNIYAQSTDCLLYTSRCV